VDVLHDVPPTALATPLALGVTAVDVLPAPGVSAQCAMTHHQEEEGRGGTHNGVNSPLASISLLKGLTPCRLASSRTAPNQEYLLQC